jgi:transposase
LSPSFSVFLPPGLSRGKTWCFDTVCYKADDSWYFFYLFIEKGNFMEQYYLGGDVSKGYSDFVILNSQKQRVEENFQLDDTIAGHSLLYNRLLSFFEEHSGAELCAAVESTGGYENNWYNALRKFQSSLNIKTARLNPAGVCRNNEAGLKSVLLQSESENPIS